MNLYIDDIDCDTYIGETHGLVKMAEPAPNIPTTLGERIDNKATVVGVLQDHEGNDYVLAVVDAAYRSGSAITWGSMNIDTLLPTSTEASDVLADHHTGKYNTDLIFNNYNITNYPAFNFARNACAITLNENVYYSVLPSVNELQLLYTNKNSIDQYDPTVNQYSARSINNFTFGSLSAWSSNERDSTRAWLVYSNGRNLANVKNENDLSGVCPVICIPLS